MEDSAEIYSQEEIEEAMQSFVVPEYAHQNAPPTPAPAPAPVQPREKVEINEPAASNENPRLFDLLKDSGKIKDSDLQTAFNKILDDPVASGKLLVMLGLADEKVVKTALKSHSKLAKHSLDDEQVAEAPEVSNAHGNGASEVEEDDDDDMPAMKSNFYQNRQQQQQYGGGNDGGFTRSVNSYSSSNSRDMSGGGNYQRGGGPSSSSPPSRQQRRFKEPDDDEL